MSNKQLQPGDDENKKPFSDENTDRRIHEHLLNEKDSISEEDIRNVKTAFDENEVKIDTNIPDKPEVTEDEAETIKDNDDPEIENDSWNILEP